MTTEGKGRCKEFYKKWKKEPNFCGLSSGSVQRMNQYFDLVSEITAKSNVPEESIYTLLPITQASPIFKYRRDSEIRAKIINNVITNVSGGRRIKRRDMQSWEETLSPAMRDYAIKRKVKLAEQGEQRRYSWNLRRLKEVLTTAQELILLEVMEKYQKDDELAALAQVLIWAKERVNAEGQKT